MSDEKRVSVNPRKKCAQLYLKSPVLLGGGVLLRYIRGRWSVAPGSKSCHAAILFTSPYGVYSPFSGAGMMLLWPDHHIGYQPGTN